LAEVCQLRTLLALCDLRAGAAFTLLAPSQMRELAHRTRCTPARDCAEPLFPLVV
jgi:hypothetical protein